MRLILTVAMVLGLAACGPSRPSAPASPLAETAKAPATIRVCRDAAGHRAECLEDPVEPRECVAADEFGRCPGDPKCFDDKGVQIHCAIPVNWVTIPAPKP